MSHFDIADVIRDFPDFRVGLVVAEGLTVPPTRTDELEAVVAAAERHAAERLGEIALDKVAALKCWRDAYRAFGVKKTSYRSSVERLAKAVQRGRGLARVNGMVDLYNAVSLEALMPVGADDLERVKLPFGFRRAERDESFIALGGETPDPPKPGEVVYADAEKCLCRRWNWYQDARSAIGPGTERAVLTVQALEPNRADVCAVSERLAALLADHCGARCAVAVADQATLRIELPLRMW